MNLNRVFGLVFAALLALAATGCVSMPEQQAYNRDVHANVKTIAVLETQPTETTVMMLNHPGANFGLIGGLVYLQFKAHNPDLETALHSSETEPA